MKKYTVISFPCSGSHWMTDFILSYPDDHGLPATQIAFVPVKEKLSVWSIARPHPEFPNVHFTHDVITTGVSDTVKWNEVKGLWNPDQYAETPLILLVRDPRDVLVSFYYQKTYRQPWQATFKAINYDPNVKKDIDEFVYHDIYGLKRIVACMNLWADIPFRITYEDMQKDMRKEMTRVFHYMDINDIDQERFERAVEHSSFDAMRLAEEIKTKDYPPSTEECNKIRKGKVGKYKEELSQDTIRFIDEYIEANLDPTYRRYY